MPVPLSAPGSTHTLRGSGVAWARHSWWRVWTKRWHAIATSSGSLLRDRNARAIAFYSKWGFEVVGDAEFVLGDDVQQDLLMARVAG